jgi:hypothetical protein
MNCKAHISIEKSAPEVKKPTAMLLAFLLSLSSVYGDVQGAYAFLNCNKFQKKFHSSLVIVRFFLQPV